MPAHQSDLWCRIPVRKFSVLLDRVPRMQRSPSRLRRGALLIRGPHGWRGSGSAAHRQDALRRDRDCATVYFAQVICLVGEPCPAPRQKIFHFPFEANHRLISPRPVPHEGRLAIVTDAGRDAVDAEVPITNGAEADGEVVWS